MRCASDGLTVCQHLILHFLFFSVRHSISQLALQRCKVQFVQRGNFWGCQRPRKDLHRFSILTFNPDGYLLSCQKPEELQADLGVEQEARLAAGQAAAEAVMHLTLTFQKSSLCAQICQRLFLLQAGRRPEQVLGQDPPSLLKFQLPREGHQPANRTSP